MIEEGQIKLLQQYVKENYEQFSGRTLERWFQTKAMESGQFTRVGNWWDKRGENEIDLMAINEFNNVGMVAEVKRNERKISMSALEKKLAALPQKDVARYNIQLSALSLKDI